MCIPWQPASAMSLPTRTALCRVSRHWPDTRADSPRPGRLDFGKQLENPTNAAQRDNGLTSDNNITRGGINLDIIGSGAEFLRERNVSASASPTFETSAITCRTYNLRDKVDCMVCSALKDAQRAVLRVSYKQSIAPDCDAVGRRIGPSDGLAMDAVPGGIAVLHIGGPSPWPKHFLKLAPRIKEKVVIVCYIKRARSSLVSKFSFPAQRRPLPLHSYNGPTAATPLAVLICSCLTSASKIALCVPSVCAKMLTESPLRVWRTAKMCTNDGSVGDDQMSMP